jgi:acyl carrier protein
MGAAPPVAEQSTARALDEVSCMALPPTLETIPAPATTLPATREALYQEIAAMYADGLPCPREMLRPEAALGAELGIDSLKQMEMLAMLAARYRLPPDPAAFRLSDHGTLRKIVDHIHQLIMFESMHIEEHITAVPLPTVAPAFIPSEDEIERERQARLASAARAGAHLTRAALQTEIVALFSEAMEYPPEVFAEDIDLEGELGIDSVKQMELLSKLEMRYQLPARPESFRLTDYGTLRKLTDFVYQAIGSAGLENPQRVPAYALG